MELDDALKRVRAKALKNIYDRTTSNDSNGRIKRYELSKMIDELGADL